MPHSLRACERMANTAKQVNARKPTPTNRSTQAPQPAHESTPCHPPTRARTRESKPSYLSTRIAWFLTRGDGATLARQEHRQKATT